MRTATSASSSAIMRCYFEEGRQACGDLAEGSTATGSRGNGVQRAGHVEVRLGQAADVVRREPQLHLVPPVHEDVGVVVGLLGGLRDAVDVGDRPGEVAELQVAHDSVAL